MHFHKFDIHPRNDSQAFCTECGFAVPTQLLTSKTNLDAWTARKNATDRLLERLGVKRGE